MQKRVSCLVLCLALFVALSAHAAAAESSVGVVVDGVTLPETTVTKVIDRNTYVSYWPVVCALYPDATVAWENGQSVARAEGLCLSVCRARYIVPMAAISMSPTPFRPREQYSGPRPGCWQGAGRQVQWDRPAAAWCSRRGPVPSSPATRIITAKTCTGSPASSAPESGNQPLSGKIAVGNVVLNRWPIPSSPTR